MQIKITITDYESDGNKLVNVECDPPVHKILSSKEKLIDLTAAEGYAMWVMNALREESKRQQREGTGLKLPDLSPAEEPDQT